MLLDVFILLIWVFLCIYWEVGIRETGRKKEMELERLGDKMDRHEGRVRKEERERE